jgi:mono/diheme cytochrome c family protein
MSARSPTGLLSLGAVTLLVALSVHGTPAAREARQTDWTIPADAAELKSPLTASPEVLEQGASVFESRCRKCHGPEGKGDGPLSDPAHPAADLTAGPRSALAPDGVLFYRIWNGRKPMPAFKAELTREEVWSVVEHVKSLRRD